MIITLGVIPAVIVLLMICYFSGFFKKEFFDNSRCGLFHGKKTKLISHTFSTQRIDYTCERCGRKWNKVDYLL